MKINNYKMIGDNTMKNKRWMSVIKRRSRNLTSWTKDHSYREIGYIRQGKIKGEYNYKSELCKVFLQYIINKKKKKMKTTLFLLIFPNTLDSF